MRFSTAQEFGVAVFVPSVELADAGELGPPEVDGVPATARALKPDLELWSRDPRRSTSTPGLIDSPGRSARGSANSMARCAFGRPCLRGTRSSSSKRSSFVMVDCGSPTSGCRGASQRGIHHGDALDERVARGDIHHGTGECGDADVVDGRDVVWRADGVVDGCRGDAAAAGCELEHKHARGSRRDVRESPQDRGRVMGHHDSVDRVVHDRRYSQPVPDVTIQRNPVRGVDINSAREACEISAAGKREQRGPVSRIGQFARGEEIAGRHRGRSSLFENGDTALPNTVSPTAGAQSWLSSGCGGRVLAEVAPSARPTAYVFGVQHRVWRTSPWSNGVGAEVGGGCRAAVGGCRRRHPSPLTAATHPQ